MKEGEKVKNHFKELDKLEQYLKDHEIPYERIDKYTIPVDQHQIVVPGFLNREWDAICHKGSYGYEDGLLEIMGSISRSEDVEGWLTAEDVIERIEEVENDD